MQEAQGAEFVEHPLIWPGAVEFRLYQKQIAEVAADRNTLVILPTALGKTIISALVASDLLYSHRDSKVLVMAPTRPLVMQHRENFVRVMKLREADTAVLTGRTSPYLRGGVWKGKARILFSTPQVVRNDLRTRRLNLSDFGLLVFDECHRAVKRYPYTEIARFYVSQAEYPLIMGLTASPGSDLERVLEVCGNLYIEQIEYRTEEDPDVKPYIQAIDVEWRFVNLPGVYLAARSQIRSMLDERVKWLHSKGIVKRFPKYVNRRNLLDAGNELRFMLEESVEEERGLIFRAIVVQSLALTLFHMLELLETQGLHTLKLFLEKVELERSEKRSYATLVNDLRYAGLKDLVEKNSIEHPKAELLREIVSEEFSRKPTSRMIVFTQYRDTASHLVENLNRVQGVRAARFVGQASKLTDRGMTQDEQEKRIRMLTSGELNILVATSIAEEGLDIPAVDHVLFYEPIPSEIRYIQRRGRTGRRTAGKVSILATEGTLDVAYLYASKRRTEKMRAIIKSADPKLQKVSRKRHRPEIDPLTSKEISVIEGEAVHITVEPEILAEEDKALTELRRGVDQAARSLYLKILARSTSGSRLSQLAFDMEPEGISITTLEGAIEKLTQRDLITESEPGVYIPTSRLKNIEVHEIFVDKVYRGFASVTVDGIRQVMLTPEDYNGPRKLIKTNSRFKASAELYEERGTLYLRVKDVTEVIR